MTKSAKDPFKKLKTKLNLVVIIVVLLVCVTAVTVLIYYPAIKGYIGSRAATITVCAGNSCDHSTIQAAINAASAGDTINVSAGTYTDPVNISKSDFTLVGVSGAAQTIIDTTGNTQSNPLSYNGPVSNVTINGFTVIPEANIQIMDGNEEAMDNISFINNIFRPNNASLIIMNGAWTNFTFQNNLVQGENNGGGLEIWVTGNSLEIINNTFVNNNGTFTYNDLDTAVFKNNIVSTSAQNAFDLAGGSTGTQLTHGYNLYTGGTALPSGLSSGTGDLAINPAFTDPDNADYTLKLISGAIDAGDPASDQDADGTRNDMGYSYCDQSVDEKMTTFYVDDDGNDGAALPTESTPWATISQALTYASSGVTISLAAGTYNESVTIGTDNITLDGAGMTDTIINAGGAANAVVIANSNTISDLTIMGHDSEGVGVQYNENNGLTLDSVIVYGTGNSNDSEQRAAQLGNNNTIQNCIFYNLGHVLDIFGTSNVVNNNVFYNNSNSAFWAQQSSTTTAQNNILVSNNSGFNTLDSASLTYSFNDIYNSPGGGQEGLTDGGDNIAVDPYFVDPENGNFQVLSNSPVIGAASDEGDMGYLPAPNSYTAPDLYVSLTSGDDGTGDGSEGSPWKTITHSLGGSGIGNKTGRTLHIAEGTHVDGQEGEDFDALNIPASTTLSGAGVGSTVISADGTVTDLFSISGNNVTVQNISFNFSRSGCGGTGCRIFSMDGDNITISNNDFDGINQQGEAIFVPMDGENYTFSNNTLRNFRTSVFNMEAQGGATITASITNNSISNCGTDPEGGTDHWPIISAWANGGSVTVTATDNIMQANTCMTVEGGATITSTYNDTYCTNRYNGLTAGTGDIYVAPAYVQTNDNTLATYFAQEDYSATNRGSSTESYMGAVEYSGVQTSEIFVDADYATYPNADSTTIGAIINNATTDYTILVAPGTYEEGSMDIITSGFTLQGNSPIDTIVDFSGGQAGLNLNGSSVTVKNLSLTNANPDSTSGVIQFYGNNSTVQDCYIYNNGIDGSEDVIKITDSVTGITLQRNAIYNNTASIGILVAPDGSANILNNVFYNNTVNTGDPSGVISATAQTTVKNNIIYNNTGSGLASELTANYNLVYGNTTDYGGGASAGTGDISANPLFTDAANADFSLLAYSPAINSGDESDTCTTEPEYLEDDECRINMGIYGNTVNAASKEYESTIYVDATNGSDTYDGTAAAVGTSPVGPKATIGACVSNLDLEDDGSGECIVAAGTYNEDVTMQSAVTLTGAGPATTIIDGTGTGDVITMNGVDGAIITGFTITGGNNGINMTNAGTEGANSIYNNIITANGASTSGGGYTMSPFAPIYNGNSYSYAIDGEDVDTGINVATSGQSVLYVDDDDTELTNIDGTENLNLCLFSAYNSGAEATIRFVYLTPDSFIPDESTCDSAATSTLGGPGWSEQQGDFFADVFTNATPGEAGGAYTWAGNASISLPNSYTAVFPAVDFEGTSYNITPDSCDDEGETDGIGVFVSVAGALEGNCSLTGAGSYNDSQYLAYDLAIVDIGVAITLYYPTGVVSSCAEVEAAIDLPADTCDKFIPNVLTDADEDGTYTYNASLLTAEGITITDGFNDPSLTMAGATSPTIPYSAGSYAYAGIYLSGAENNTFYNNYIHSNGNGLMITGTSDSNTFSYQATQGYQNSQIKSNTQYNVTDDTAVTGTTTFLENDLDYVANPTKINVSGDATLDISYKIRTYIDDPDDAEVCSATVTYAYTDASSEEQTASDLTNAEGAESTGYTVYRTFNTLDITSSGATTNVNDMSVSVLHDDYSSPAPEDFTLRYPSWLDTDNYNTVTLTLESSGSEAFYPRIPAPVATPTAVETPSTPTSGDTPVVDVPGDIETIDSRQQTAEVSDEQTVITEEGEEERATEVTEGEQAEERPLEVISDQETEVVKVGVPAVEIVVPPTADEVKEKDTVKLVKAEDSSTVYVVDTETGIRQPILSEAVFDEMGYSWDAIEIVEIQELQIYAQAAPVLYPAGTVVKFSDSRVYEVTSDYRISWIPDEATFEASYSWDNVMVLDDSLMALFDVE